MNRTLQIYPHLLLCSGLLCTGFLLTGCRQNSNETGSHRTEPSQSEVAPALVKKSPEQPPTEKTTEAQKTPSPKAPIKATPVSSKKIKIAKITFDDLKLEIKEDMVYEEKHLTDRVKELVGKTINVTGFIHPGSTYKTKGISQFILIRNLQCKFGPGGQFHHNLRVDMKEGLTTSYTTGPVSVEGVLSLQPYEGPDGKTWSIYFLECHKVK